MTQPSSGDRFEVQRRPPSRTTYLGVPCSECGQDTIPGQRGECLWCETPLEAKP